MLLNLKLWFVRVEHDAMLIVFMIIAWLFIILISVTIWGSLLCLMILITIVFIVLKVLDNPLITQMYCCILILFAQISTSSSILIPELDLVIAFVLSTTFIEF
jgi:hypothetical protein